MKLPKPILLSEIHLEYQNRWVPVSEALPPEGFHLLVIVRGDNCPAYAWLKFSAGDKLCPYFVCPQTAAIGPRGCECGKKVYAKNKTDVTQGNWSKYGETDPARDFITVKVFTKSMDYGTAHIALGILQSDYGYRMDRVKTPDFRKVYAIAVANSKNS